MPKKSEPKITPESMPLKNIAADKAGALRPEDSAKTAGDRMREHETGTWPVAEDCKLVGMIDTKNPDWQLGGKGHDPKTWKVGQIMSREIVFCYEDEDCAAARKLMDERGLSYLPVVDRQMRVVGVFSRDEVAEKVDAKSGES